MSRRRELDEHLHSLGDIRGILRAMRNLALMEVQKLGRVSSTQRQAIDLIERAAADFLNWYPLTLTQPALARPLVVLIGSERGFCGDFNEAVTTAFATNASSTAGADPLVILVGSRLALHGRDLPTTSAVLQGPSATEEIPAIISRLADHLRVLHSKHDMLCLLDATLIHHVSTDHHSEVTVRRPFLGLTDRDSRHAYPPLLNLTPEDFAAELVDHYLYAILHDVLYSSLLAENQRRFQHMEHALQRLDTTMSKLTLKRNTTRQEEITEEIETILLSADSLGMG